MKITHIEEHLDSDQELEIELEDWGYGPTYVYMTYPQYLKIKAAFEEYLNA